MSYVSSCCGAFGGFVPPLSEERGKATTAEKGGLAEAAAMAECIASGGHWTGVTCIYGDNVPALTTGGGTTGTTTGGGYVPPPVMPTPRQPQKLAGVDVRWLAAAGAVALIGGAWLFTRPGK